MNCSRCHAAIPGGVSFCPHCGTPVNLQPPPQGYAQPPYQGQPQPPFPGQPQPPFPGQHQPPHQGQPQPPFPGQAQPPYQGQPRPPFPGQAQPPHQNPMRPNAPPRHGMQTPRPPHRGPGPGMPPISGQPPRPPKKGGKLPWILLALAVLAGAFFLFRDGGPGGDSGKIALGASAELAHETIPPTGGSLTVSKPGSALDGMTLSVPEGAYGGETAFDIRETEITAQQFGDLFTPVTPLITVENGHGFATVPMKVTIPIQKTDDEFAMGFYYDRETGTLEGIPATDLTNDSITLLTRHFSEIVVSKVRTDRIMDDVDTGFRPGRDDIQVPNYGSWLNPGGHCAGQSFCNIVYWKYHKAGRAGWDTPLSYRFDNASGHEKTMDFPLDDALMQRLSSAAHKNHAVIWGNWSPEIAQYWADHAANDRKTLHAFAYSMALTGLPQMMDIRGVDAATNQWVGHAILIYGISGTTLQVCDPNFPGSDRTIQFDPAATDDGQNATGSFANYSSGNDATLAVSNAMPYTRFGYMGMSALIDVGHVTALWNDAMQTGGKEMIDPLFPTEQAFSIITGMDANDQPIVQRLTDGMRIPPAALALSFGMGKLYVAPDQNEPDTDYLFYLGNDLVIEGTDAGVDRVKYAAIPLPQGVSDLGMMTQRKGADGKYHFLNFRRYRVIVGDAALTVSPETATVANGDIVNFSTTLTGTVEKPLYVWDFNDGTETMQGSLPEMPHMYEKEGAFTGTVSVRDESDPSTVLADASFTIEVGPPASDTPEPNMGGGAYGGTWTVQHTYTEECQHSGGIKSIGHGLRYGAIGGAVPEYMNVPMTMDLEIVDGNVTENADGTLTIVVGGLDNYTLAGTVSADGSISGTITETYGQGQHWIKGTFRMIRK